MYRTFSQVWCEKRGVCKRVANRLLSRGTACCAPTGRRLDPTGTRGGEIRLPTGE
ncbi:MAG: hypothetical protein QXU79_04250 [Candidatus Micrarchaeaceae archaeon]